MSKQIIALVGSTVGLGPLIGKVVLDKPDVRLRLLAKRGAEVVQGTLGESADAERAALCQGASTVICALQGGPDVIIDGQRQLLRETRDVGLNASSRRTTSSVRVTTVREYVKRGRALTIMM